MPLRVLIVGAGIGGPAAAAALAKKGHRVTIFERAKSTTEVGFAFRITPNSDRCLKHFGIDTVAGGAVAAKGMRMFNRDGEVMFQRVENSDQEKAKKGTSVFAFRVSYYYRDQHTSTYESLATTCAAAHRCRIGFGRRN